MPCNDRTEEDENGTDRGQHAADGWQQESEMETQGSQQAVKVLALHSIVFAGSLQPDCQQKSKYSTD